MRSVLDALKRIEARGESFAGPQAEPVPLPPVSAAPPAEASATMPQSTIVSEEAEAPSAEAPLEAPTPSVEVVAERPSVLEAVAKGPVEPSPAPIAPQPRASDVVPVDESPLFVRPTPRKSNPAAAPKVADPLAHLDLLAAELETLDPQSGAERRREVGAWAPTNAAPAAEDVAEEFESEPEVVAADEAGSLATPSQPPAEEAGEVSVLDRLDQELAMVRSQQATGQMPVRRAERPDLSKASLEELGIQPTPTLITPFRLQPAAPELPQPSAESPRDKLVAAPEAKKPYFPAEPAIAPSPIAWAPPKPQSTLFSDQDHDEPAEAVFSSPIFGAPKPAPTPITPTTSESAKPPVEDEPWRAKLREAARAAAEMIEEPQALPQLMTFAPTKPVAAPLTPGSAAPSPSLSSVALSGRSASAVPRKLPTQQIAALRERLFEALPATSSRSLLMLRPGVVTGSLTVLCELGLALVEEPQTTVLLVDVTNSLTSLASEFHLPRQPGLHDVLGGRARWQDACRLTNVPGLSVLPRGKLHEFTDQWQSDHMLSLLAKIQHDYRFVLFDAALSEESLIRALAPVCQGVALLLGQDETGWREAATAANLVHSLGGKLMGSVLVRGAA